MSINRIILYIILIFSRFYKCLVIISNPHEIVTCSCFFTTPPSNLLTFAFFRSSFTFRFFSSWGFCSISAEVRRFFCSFFTFGLTSVIFEILLSCNSLWVSSLLFVMVFLYLFQIYLNLYLLF